MYKITVIIPTFNRPDLLDQAVKSVLAQSLPCHEIMIIDDGSDQSDDLTTIVGQHSSIILLKNQRTKGPSGCRNTGIDQATGTHLIFLDDDDLLHPDMLESTTKTLLKSGVDAASCQVEFFSEYPNLSTEKVEKYNNRQKKSQSKYSLVSHPAAHISFYNPPIHTFLISKAAIGESRFDETLIYGEDFVFWLTLVNEGVQFTKTGIVGASYRLHEKNASMKSEYESKHSFYQRILSRVTCPKANNIWHIKMTYFYLKNWKIKGLYHLIMSLLRLRFFISHVNYFLTTK